MSIELIKKIQNGVRLKYSGYNNYMLLVLCSMTAVIAPHLLPLHPCIGQLFKLRYTQTSVISLMSRKLTHISQKYPKQRWCFRQFTRKIIRFTNTPHSSLYNVFLCITTVLFRVCSGIAARFLTHNPRVADSNLT